MEICKCCEKDKKGDWIHDPCCNNSGICEADTEDPNETLSMCAHCGAQMFKQNGFWFHHEQEEIQFEQREPQLGI